MFWDKISPLYALCHSGHKKELKTVDKAMLKEKKYKPKCMERY